MKYLLVTELGFYYDSLNLVNVVCENLNQNMST